MGASIRIQTTPSKQGLAMAMDAGKIDEPASVEETLGKRGDSVKAIHINERIVN